MDWSIHKSPTASHECRHHMNQGAPASCTPLALIVFRMLLWSLYSSRPKFWATASLSDGVGSLCQQPNTMTALTIRPSWVSAKEYPIISDVVSPQLTDQTHVRKCSHRRTKYTNAYPCRESHSQLPSPFALRHLVFSHLRQRKASSLPPTDFERATYGCIRRHRYRRRGRT